MTKVKLIENIEEGWEEEFGELLGPSGPGTYIVRLNKEFIHDEDDDGLREVTSDQIEFTT
jgi:hypothetical protein